MKTKSWRTRMTAVLAITMLGMLTVLAGVTAMPESFQRSASSAAPGLLIDSVLYDGQALNDLDEAVAVRNVGAMTVDIAGYQIGDGGGSVGTVPSSTLIAPGQLVWLARNGEAFAAQFGAPPDIVLTGWPGFSNSGDEVVLRDPAGAPIDVLVYTGGDTLYPGWSGASVTPYSSGSNFRAEGQILYRMRDQLTGQPVPDTNLAEDWAQSRTDVINGRKVRYPGWDSEQYFRTKQITATGTLTVSVAPDNSYESVVGLIGNAQDRIRLASLTLENLGVARALAEAAGRGVDVKILLEGAPAGGIDDYERYACQIIEAAGGTCWFMVADDVAHIHDRYRFMHAKYIVVDGHIVAVSSENFSPDSMPYDDKSDGTIGRRGVILLLDTTPVAAYLENVFNHDLNPARPDIFRWNSAHEDYGRPPPDFMPQQISGGAGYTVRYVDPLIVLDNFGIEIIQSPDNSLRDVDGLLGLMARAGAGDTLLMEHLSERPFWGKTEQRNVLSDPNPRLEAAIAAARRGATVKLLLDSFFDDSRAETSNAATCTAVNRIARAEHLPMLCVVANPTLMGIHNKMILARIDGRGYVHVGSLNGTEMSSKGNREMAIQIQSDAAYYYLAAMFEEDMPHMAFVPLALTGFRGPSDHLLITEVYYDPPGLDDKEFIEIGNPLPGAVSLAGYTLGDAVWPTDFEDVRVFPAGMILESGDALVVAFSATAFQAEFGFLPDLEIVNSSAEVPDMIDEPGWGDPAALLQLGNSGDEVVLRRGLETIDAVVYGDGSFDNLVECPLLAPPDQSLERFPHWRDTDNCTTDFRGWPFPSPGQLP